MMNFKPLKKGAYVLLAAATVAGSVIGGSKISSGLMEYASNLKLNRDAASSQYLARANQLIHIGDTESAFWNLQMAVANAVDTTQRSSAATRMAEHLLQRARKEPIPYALMARQYAEAVLDSETDPSLRYRACSAMIELALILKDTDMMEPCLQEGIRNAPTREEASAFGLRKMEVLIELGRFDELKKSFETAAEFSDVNSFETGVVLQRAALLRKLMADRTLIARWAGPDADADAVLADMKKSVESKLLDVASGPDERQASEALFQLAAINMAYGDYEAAQELLERFLMTESNTHQSEVLMYMAQIARREGKIGRAERMLDIFVKRFSWNKIAANEFLEVANELIKRGRAKDALNLMDKYLDAGLEGELQEEILSAAAHAAVEGGFSDRALGYYRKLYEISDDDRLSIEALLEQARILQEKGDLLEARNVLFDYLAFFPYEAKRGDAYFQIYDLEMQLSNASPASAVFIASAASLEKPDDIRTKRVMLSMAQTIESMGLINMARDQYGRIALLHYVSGSTGGVTVAESPVVFDAMLGAGRCYMKMDEVVMANGIFRDLCNNLPPCRTRSEAAYYWGMMALHEKQFPEARRRFGLIDHEQAGEDLVIRSGLEVLLMNITDRGGSDTNDYVYAESLISRADEAHRSELWARFARDCMSVMELKGNSAGMQEFFLWASASGSHAQMPLRDMHARTGKMLLEDGTVEEYGRFLLQTDEVMGKIDVDYAARIKQFRDVVNDIEDLKKAKNAVL